MPRTPVIPPGDESEWLEKLLNEKDAKKRKQNIEIVANTLQELRKQVTSLRAEISGLERDSRETFRGMRFEARETDSFLSEFHKNERSRQEETAENFSKIVNDNAKTMKKLYLDDNSAYKDYIKNLNSYRKTETDKINKQLGAGFENLNRVLQKELTKQSDLYEKLGKSTNIFSKMWWKGRVNSSEKSIAKIYNKLEDLLEKNKDLMDDGTREGWIKSLEDVKEVIDSIGDTSEKVSKKSIDAFDRSFGKGNEGLISKINDTLQELSGIDLLQALNLKGLAGELDSEGKNWYKQQSELQASYGISTEQSDRWYKSILEYSSTNLHNALNSEDASELIKQFVDAGIHTDEEFYANFSTILDSMQGNLVQLEDLSGILETDLNQGYNGELLYNMQNFISAAKDSVEGSHFNAQQLTNSVGDIISTAATSLHDLNGNALSQEQVIEFARSTTASQAAAADMMEGEAQGALAGAVKSLTEKILEDNVYTNDSLAKGMMLTDQGLENLRYQLLSGDAEQYFAAQQQIYASVLNSARLTQPGTANSLWSTELLGELASDEDAMKKIAASINSPEKVQELLDRQKEYAIALADENIGNALGATSEKNTSITPIMEQTANAVSNWFNQSWMGDVWKHISGNFDVSLGDIYGQLVAIKLAIGGQTLFGNKEGGLLGKIKSFFGRGGGGSAGGEAAAGGASGGFFTRVKGFFSKLTGSGGSSVPLGQDAGLFSDVADLGEYASSWGSAPAALEGSAGGGIFSKLIGGAKGLGSKALGSLSSIGGKAMNAIGKVAPWMGLVQGGIDAFQGIQNAEAWTGDAGLQGQVSSGIGAFIGGTGNGLKEGDFMENLMEIGGGALKGAAIGSFGGPIGTAIGAVVGGIGSAIGGDTISQWINTGINGIKDVVTGAGNWIADTASNAGEWLKGGAENVLEGFKEGGPLGAIRAQQENLYNAVKGIPVIGDFVQGAENVFKNIAYDLSQTPVGQAVTGFVDQVRSGAENVKEKIKEFAGNIWEGAQNIASQAWQGAQDIAGQAWQGAQDIAGKAWQGAQDLWNQLANSPVGQGIQQFADMINQGAQTVWNNVTTLAGNLWQGAQDIASTVGNFFGGIGENISNWWGDVTDTAGQIWNGVTNAAGQAWNKVSTFAGEAWNGVTGAASQAGSYLVGLTQDPNIRNNPAGSHAGGLSEVPYDNYLAVLHKGESVLTAGQANAFRSDGGINVSDSLTNSIKNALYGSTSATSTTTVADMLNKLSSDELEYFSKAIKYDSDSFGVLKKMSPSVDRLVNRVWTGTYASKSEFKATSPSTKPAGQTENLTKSLADALTPGTELTPIPGKENYFTDEKGNIVVTNPSTGQTVTTATPEEAVRPTHAEGTPFLPQDEVALIHQGEMIVPSYKNPLSNTVSTETIPLNQDNDDIIQTLRWLGTALTNKLDEVEKTIQATGARIPVNKPYQGPSMTDIAFRY